MITITISGDNAGEALSDFRTLASALLGSASAQSIAVSVPESVRVIGKRAELAAPYGEEQGTATPVSEPTAETRATENVNEVDSDDVDTDGHPWSEEFHAATKSKTKDGRWRLKVGGSRPAPMPGFPKSDDGIETAGETSTPIAPAPVETAQNVPSDTDSDAGQEDDDEFAAFRAAADKSAATDTEAVAAIPARKWTDTDLGALCNQAAVKLGDPAPIKALIAEYVPEGTVPHSRNIPDDKRDDFAKAVEAKAGVEFAG